MNLRERLSLGARIIFGGRSAQAKAAAALMRPSWETTQPSYALSGNFPVLVEEGYYKNELIYACVNKSANSAAQISLVVRRKKDRALVPDHPLLELIHTPNDEMNERDLWASAMIYQKLAGRALYEKVRARSGKVVQLQPLRPDYVQVQPGRLSRIGSYFYRPPGTDGAMLAPQDVLDIPLFDPMLRFTTRSPLSVLARSGDVDNSITDFIKLFFENGGAPQGVFTSDAEMDDDDVDAARRRFRERYGGYRNWVDPAFVSGQGLKYQQMGSSFKDMGFETLDERNEARICEVMDVPPIIVGARVGLKEATYSNYAQARKAWWEDSLSPTYVNYLDVIGRLLDEMDPSGEYYADWDFSQVKAFQEENNERWNRATNALRSGAITINTFNEQVGLPSEGPKGDVRLMPLNVVMVPKGVLMQPAASTSGSTGDGKIMHAQLKAHVPADADARTAAEQKMAKAMEKFFAAEWAEIQQRLESQG